MATETESPIWVASAQTVLATLAAFRGQEDRAEEVALEAERVAAPLHAGFILAVVQLARGIAALGAGRPAEGYDQLRRMYDPADAAYHHFVRTWAVGDIIEAALQSGHREAVQPIMEEMEHLAGQTPAWWLHAGIR